LRLEAAGGERVCRPEGETDSEFAFCHLLGRVVRDFHAPDWLASLAEASAEIARLGQFNFLLSDGEHLIAHGHDRLHRLEASAASTCPAIRPARFPVMQHHEPARLPGLQRHPPIRPGVLEAMLPWLREGYRNPSFDHPCGRQPREAVVQALWDRAATRQDPGETAPDQPPAAGVRQEP
jgi:hypothetical protein